MDTIEILKESEDGTLSILEACEVIPIFVGYNIDTANGYVAFAVNMKTRNDASALVDKLNSYSDNKSPWYVGDSDEEYVYTN